MNRRIGTQSKLTLLSLCLITLLNTSLQRIFASAPSCEIEYEIDWADPTAFGASVTIHNTGITPINSWEVGWQLTDQQQITSVWNGVLSQDGTAVTDAGWNKTINPDQSVFFGLQGNGDSTTPTQITLNGELCNGQTEEPTAPAESLLAIYALAFDTPNSSHNLSQHYGTALNSIILATEGVENVTAAVLIDLDGKGDTHIFVFADGEGTFIEGLPGEDGVLSAEINEYNMADGLQLGGFLQWARATYPATETTFSYVGHGTALAPETDLSAFTTVSEEVETDEDGISTTPWVVNVNPWVVNVNPWVVNVNPWVVNVNPWVVNVNPWVVNVNTSWTDEHTGDATAPVALLTPHDLSVALEIGTAAGSDPITVLDTLHCFGGTIEQLYELANPDAEPYAETIIASPNYHYFAPPMLGAGLSALAMAPADKLGTTLAEAYEGVMQTADQTNEAPTHPRSVVVVESAEIPAVKEAVDTLAGALLTRFDESAVSAKDLISAAYAQSGTYYDTTYCDQDYALAPPDALVDITALMRALGEQFGTASPVGTAAQAVTEAVQNATMWRTSADGLPWFAPEGTNDWVFSAADSSGIAIYADFGGRTGGTVPVNQRYLAWLAPFYADAPVLFNNTNLNEHPYQFVQGETTWAHVFVNYWATKTAHEELELQSEFCTPSIAPTQPEIDGQRIVGSYHVEDVAQRNYLPADIPADQLTHLNYVGVTVNAEAECVIADADTAYDLQVSRVVAWTHGNDHLGILNQLRLLRDYYPHLKLLFAVEGEVSAESVASCAALVAQEQFDGLNVTTTDSTVLAALRDALPADALLTVDGGETVTADVASVVDWVNLPATLALPDAIATAEAWLDAGVTAAQLNLSLSYEGQSDDGNTYDYWNIALNYAPQPGYTTTWDSVQAIPTTANSVHSLVYENAESVTAKATYAQQLGGVTVLDLAAEGVPGSAESPLTGVVLGVFSAD